MVNFRVRMPQKNKSPVGLIKDFFNAVEKQDIIAIQDKVLSLIQGSIHIARQKLQTLKLPEATTVISSTGSNLELKYDVEHQICEIFDDEVSKAEDMLKTAAVGIRRLDDSIESINTSLFSLRKSGESIDPLVSQCYEDCHTILVYLKLRNKLLKHALLVPIYTPLSPSNIFPQKLQDENEYIIFLLCKIQCGL